MARNKLPRKKGTSKGGSIPSQMKGVPGTNSTEKKENDTEKKENEPVGEEKQSGKS